MLCVVNKGLWFIATFLLLVSGIYFSIVLKFKQFNIVKMFRAFFSRSNSNVTSFQTLSISLGARVGVGSLAGVALAIKLGGRGTIFWFWISSLILSINTYVESFLGTKFKNSDLGGGPSYYIKYGLNSKMLSVVYAVVVILAYIGGFLTIQSNTITKVFIGFGYNKLLIAFFICLISALIIFGGINKIVRFTSVLVPLMSCMFLMVGIFIISKNILLLPSILKSIVVDAFNINKFGIGVVMSLIIGVQRGVFSTESGIGTSAMAAGLDNDVNSSNQAFIQVFGVHFTTFVISTITAIIILTSDYSNLFFEDVNGIEITYYAFHYHLGEFGSLVLTICILLFSFSTIVSGYYYGEMNLNFLIHTNKFIVIVFKILTLVLLFLGSLLSSGLLWSLVDILVALMAIINIYSLISLKEVVAVR